MYCSSSFTRELLNRQLQKNTMIEYNVTINVLLNLNRKNSKTLLKAFPVEMFRLY